MPFANTSVAMRTLESLAAGVASSEPQLLVGETGIGKTSIVQHLADAVGQKLVVVNLSQQSEASDLLGGLKPLTVRSLVLPVAERFNELFEITFPSSNEKFKAALAKALSKQSWTRLLKLWQEAIHSVQQYLTKSMESRNGKSVEPVTKKRKLGGTQYTTLQERWSVLSSSIDQVRHRVENQSGTQIFAFVEGRLVEAVRSGFWLLLDEINLAASDSLDHIGSLLRQGTQSNPFLLLSEANKIERIEAHPNFRIFAAMNPATDTGKKDLVPNIRSRFTELYVHAGDNEISDLVKVIQAYLGNILASDNKAAVHLANAYLKVQEINKSRQLTDGAGVNNPTSFLARQPKIPTDGKEFIAFKHHLIPKGPLAPDFQPHYIRTPSVDRNLLNLARAASTCRFPVLLQGPTSAGKTSMVEYLAKLSGHKFVRINNHEHTDLQEYLGNYASGQDGSLQFREDSMEDLITRFQAMDPSTLNPDAVARVHTGISAYRSMFLWNDGSLVRAMKSGEHFLLDEISLTDDSVLERLNSVLEPSRTVLLAEKGSLENIVTAKSDFQFLATMNPGGDYGKRELSAALRNRMTEIWVPPLTQSDDILPIMKAKLGDKLDHFAQSMLDFAKWFAINFRNNTAASIVHLRDLLAWCNFIYSSPTLGAELAFVHGASLVYIDSLGASPAALAANLVADIENSRLKCVEQLQTYVTIPVLETYMDIPKLELTDESVVLGPFTKTRVSTVTRPLQGLVFDARTTRKNMLRVMRALQMSRPILLEGSPGVGKTAIVTTLASLVGKPLSRINLSDQTDIADLFGADAPLDNESLGNFSWQDGPLLKAMQEGSWVLLDEMNLASQSVLEGLNSCIDHRKQIYVAELDRTFDCHPDFRLFAAQNPHHQGGGRKGLPLSFVNRFTVVYADAFTQDDILSICRVQHPTIDTEAMLSIVNFASQAEAVLGKDSVYANGGPLAAAAGARLVEISMNSDIDTMDLLGGFEQYDEEREIQKLKDNILLLLQNKLGFQLLQTDGDSISQLIALHKACCSATTSLESLRQALYRVTGSLDEAEDLLSRANYILQSRHASGAKFVWNDGVLVDAILKGAWVVLDDANMCNAAVLDRLNSLLEPNGHLVISEQHGANGDAVLIKPHRDFRIILTMDPKYGTAWDAMAVLLIVSSHLENAEKAAVEGRALTRLERAAERSIIRYRNQKYAMELELLPIWEFLSATVKTAINFVKTCLQSDSALEELDGIGRVARYLREVSKLFNAEGFDEAHFQSLLQIGIDLCKALSTNNHSFSGDITDLSDSIEDLAASSKNRHEIKNYFQKIFDAILRKEILLRSSGGWRSQPILKTFGDFKILTGVHESTREATDALQRLSIFSKGIDPQSHSLTEQILSEVSAMQHQSLQTVVVARPESSELGKVQDEFTAIIRNILDTAPKAILSMKENISVCQDFLQSWPRLRTNMDRVESRLGQLNRAYDDIVVPAEVESRYYTYRDSEQDGAEAADVAEIFPDYNEENSNPQSSDQSGNFQDLSVDYVLPAILLQLRNENKALAGGDDNLAMNIYTDASIPEIRKLVALVQDVQNRFNQISNRFPEHAVPHEVISFTEEVLDFPINSPLAKILTKAEKLLEIMSQWQSVASSEWSVASLMEGLTYLIISWRRMELSSWSKLLLLEKQKSDAHVKTWFFIAYEACIYNPRQIVEAGDVSSYCHGVAKTLEEFLQFTTLGQFSPRLKLLGILSKSLMVLEREDPRLGPVLNCVQNVVSHFSRYDAKIQESLRTGQAELEKAVMEQIKLASWKDTNTMALRESARRSHFKLFKIVKKYRALLEQPISSFKSLELDLGPQPSVPNVELEALSPSDNAVLRAYQICENGIPDWNSRPSRLRDPISAAMSMRHVYNDHDQSVDVAHEMSNLRTELAVSIKELRKQTPTTLTDENAATIKHLRERKKKLLSETIKSVAHMGVRRNLAACELEKQSSIAVVLAAVPALDQNASFKPADASFYELLDSMPQIRASLGDHSADLTDGEVRRAVGLLEGLLSIILSQRRRLSASFDALNKFNTNVQLLKTTSSFSSDIMIGSPTPSFIALVKYLPWLAVILDVSCDVIHFQQEQGDGLNLLSLKELLQTTAIMCREEQTRVETMMSQCSLPEGLFSKQISDWQVDTWTKLRHFGNTLREWSVKEPNIGYLIKQVIPWTAPPHAIIETRQPAIEGHLGSPDVDEHLRKAADSIFVALQDLSQVKTHASISTEDAGWLVRSDQFSQDLMNSLHVQTVSGSLRDALDRLRYLKGEELQLSLSLLTMAAPLFEQFQRICQNLLQKQATSHIETCRLACFLTKTFATVSADGYCSPTDPRDGQEQSGDVESGTGLGEGEGAEDISKDVGSDEDLSEFAQGGEKREDGGEMSDNEEAIDMGSEDLQGDMDKEGKDTETQDGGSEKGESGDDMEEEAGAVDDLDPAAVDEKMWDEAAKKSEEKEKELKTEKQKGTKGQDQTERQDGEAESGDEGDMDESDANHEEREDDELGEGKPEAENLDSHVEDENALELPDEMQLDGEEKSGENDLSDDDMDNLSDIEQPAGITEEVEEIEDADKEDQSDDAEDVEEKDSFADGRGQDDEAMEDQTDEAHAEAPNAERTENCAPEDEEGQTGGETGNADCVQTEINSQQEAEGHNEVMQMDNEEKLQGGKAASEHDKGPSGQGAAERIGGRDDQSQNPQDQALRRLADVLERWHQRSEILDSSNDRQDGEIDGADMAHADFEHVEGEDENDAQALGAASAEQAQNLDFSQAIQSQDKLIEEDVHMPEIQEEEALSEALQLDRMNRLHAALNGESKDDYGNSFVPSYDRNQPTMLSGASDEENPDDVDGDSPTASHNQSIDEAHTGPQTSSASAAELWLYCSQLVRSYSLVLTEQLRLILSPTTATKLRGDFRTGKRLNIKRIIPYIASGYKRDKIWMRRSVPSKRNYQVLLAVDDSKSMSESGVDLLALQTTALLCTSLSMLEVGDISVIGFGEAPKVTVAHEFGKPWTNESGVEVFQHFGFNQQGTNVKSMVAQSLEMLREARMKSMASNASELWQLQLIISDGHCSDHEAIQRLVRQAKSERVVMVFAIVDNSAVSAADGRPGESILDLKEAVFEPDLREGREGEMRVVTRRYLESFPFEYYLVVRNRHDQYIEGRPFQSKSLSLTERRLLARARLSGIESLQQLEYEADVGHTNDIGSRMTDTGQFRQDLDLWRLLLEFSQHRNGAKGAKKIWLGMMFRGKPVQLESDNRNASDLVQSIIAASAADDIDYLKTFVKDCTRRGILQDQLFIWVVGTLLLLQPEAAPALAIMLRQSCFQGKADLLEIFHLACQSDNPNALRCFCQVHCLFPGFYVYEDLIPSLWEANRTSDALMLHQHLLSNGDLPRTFKVLKPFVQHIASTNGDLEAFLGDLRAADISFDAQVRRLHSTLLAKPLEKVNEPRKISDEIAARILASFPFEFAIRNLRFFGLIEVGPLSVRQMVKSATTSKALKERFQTLKEFEIDLGSSAFVRLGRLEELERLLVWLADWYTASSAKRHSAAKNLSSLFTPPMQNAIIDWSFKKAAWKQYRGDLKDLDPASSSTTTGSSLPWLRGAIMLKTLRDEYDIAIELKSLHTTFTLCIKRLYYTQGLHRQASNRRVGIKRFGMSPRCYLRSWYKFWNIHLTQDEEDQLVISAVLREIRILSALSAYHGFAAVRSCHVVRGPWHEGFLEAYHAFRKNHPDLALNPLPSERWDDEMIYGVIEMDDAGLDLEKLTKPSAFQVYDAFWMTTVLLALVERELEFEHRDLHMSNILYREHIPGKGLDICHDLVSGMKDHEPAGLLGLTNLKITIIDYTMSRLRLKAGNNYNDDDDGNGRDNHVLFNPDSAWSTANSDRVKQDQDVDDHQTRTGLRIHRLVSLHHQEKTLSKTDTHNSHYDNSSNKWRAHLPATTTLWLAHILHQLLLQAGSRPRHVPGSSARAKRLQTRIWKQLREVLETIDRDDPAALNGSGAVDLLNTGMEKGWIQERDVQFFKDRLNDEL
ncbi:hypothetical protein DV737_g2172, partial [Chaetothyriales sp. CBS 132003]